MAIEQAIRFLSEVSADEQLLDHYLNAQVAGQEEILQLAQSLGYYFSGEELQLGLKEQVRFIAAGQSLWKR